MSNNKMLVDHWEEFNQKRLEFKNLMRNIISQAFRDGPSANYNLYTPEAYAELKLKDLF